jgi:class 3 adenylate cyclase/predicted ATPase
MRCPSCNHDNSTDALFCDACGAKLESICATCGTTNQPGARFCKKCGTRIATESASAKPAVASTAPKVRVTAEQAVADSGALEGERKTVTALFADIKGSTELMENLDPEEARAIVDPALKLMIDAVRRYDGYVVQSTGDGIFALFGAPVAHEDHPQRALHAALRMQEELKRHSDRVRADGGLPIQARIGVNTGEVVVRSITTGEGQTEYTPIGHTTNLASRMQTLAPIGSIAATETTRKLCEGYFTFKALGPTKVKGVAEPVGVHEVTGIGPLRTRLQRAAGRGLTKFVGREREMETMKHAAGQAQTGHGQIVAAMAEQGVGKSRLYFEFKATSQSGWMVLETISNSYGKASAYLPVIELLRNYFDISAGDDERKRREKVTGRVLALDRSLEDTLPYLFSLLGIVEGEDTLAQMDGRIRKRRTLDAIKLILLRESLNRPLMVIFEDLHWIDEQTQELLNLLAGSIGTAKILLLMNYRPEYSHHWNSKTYYTQLKLDPLGKESAAEMLSALVGDGMDLLPIKRLIIERTEGTPFFMEEIVQSLFEDAVLKRNGAVKLIKSMNAVKVPATVQSVIAARIDRLSAEDKELLQTLAVLGREFPFELVRRVTLNSDEDLNRMLGDLQLAEFIYEQPAVGDTEYIFKHALTQEVASNSLLIERRKQLHERAGQALESMFAGQVEDHLDALADHYSRSDNIEKAVEYLGRAGQQAGQRSAYGGAISKIGVAINLLQKLPDSPQRAQRELLLQLAIGPALIAVNGFAAMEVEKAYARARALCKRLNDPPELFPTLYGLWVMHHIRGDLRTAYQLSKQLLELAQDADDRKLLMHASLLLGVTSFYMGDFLHCREHLETADSLYDPDRDRRMAVEYGVDPRVGSQSFGSWALWQLGYADQSVKKASEALAFGQALSHPFSDTFARYFAEGILHQSRRQAGAAQASTENVIALAGEHGFTQFLAWGTSLLGWAMAAQGRHEEGIAQLREGLAASRAAGAELWRPYFLCLLAEAFMETGRFGDGLGAVTEALAFADEQEIGFSKPELYRLKAELLFRQDDSNAAEAQSNFQFAIETARKQSGKTLELRATMGLARLLASQARRDEARAMLAEIYGWFTEGFDTADLKEAKVLLEELQARPVLGEQR